MAEKKYRDSVFRHYFISDKRRLLSLLNALMGTKETDPEKIEINTLTASMLSAARNDVSCFFRGQWIILIEHQSTLNENMPLRFLFYITDLLRKMIKDPRQLYRRKRLKFPTPKFFVMYNGTNAAPERSTLTLSESFDMAKTIELKAEFLNINAGNNEKFIKQSLELSWYCAFVERVKYNQHERKMPLAEAIKEAMEYCITNDIMADYLKDHRWEVLKMYQYEYDAELALRASYEDGLEDGMERGRAEGKEEGRAEGKEEGRAEGRVEGKEEDKLETIGRMMQAGVAMDIIEIATGWTREQILAVVKNKQ